MTVSHHSGGLVLCLSREELPHAASREDLLPLIRRRRERLPVSLPPDPEIHCFQSRTGVILFLLPRPLSPLSGGVGSRFSC